MLDAFTGALEIHGHDPNSGVEDRPGHLPRPRAAELELTSDAESGRLTWQIRAAESVDAEHQFRPTNLMEKVSRYVASHIGELPSRNQVEEKIKGRREFVPPGDRRPRGRGLPRRGGRASQRASTSFGQTISRGG